MSLLKLDDKQAENKLSIIRRYIVELLIVGLCVFCGYLFKTQKDFEKIIRDYLTEDRQLLIERLEVNTQALYYNSSIIEEMQSPRYNSFKPIPSTDKNFKQKNQKK
jgi:hypothetical protein